MSNNPPIIATEDPLQDEVARLTNIIMAQIGPIDVESALCVVCNLAGQLVAALAEGKPSGIIEQTKSLAENIRRAAITKILYDDELIRKEKQCQH